MKQTVNTVCKCTYITYSPYPLIARVALVKCRDLHWAMMAHKDQRDTNLSSIRMLIVADGANPCESLLLHKLCNKELLWYELICIMFFYPIVCYQGLCRRVMPSWTCFSLMVWSPRSSVRVPPLLRPWLWPYAGTTSAYSHALGRDTLIQWFSTYSWASALPSIIQVIIIAPHQFICRVIVFPVMSLKSMSLNAK